MNFYIVQLFIFVLYSFLFFFVNFNYYKIYYWVVCLHLSLIMGLRSINVGTDTSTNVNDYLVDYTSNTYIYTYNFIKHFCYHFSNGNYHCFLMILSILTVSLYLYCIYLIQPSFIDAFLNIYLYITLYYYFSAFNVQRQMLAVSLSTLMVILIIFKKNIKALLLFLMAVTVHNTAFITALSVIVVKEKKSKKTLFLTMLFLILFITFGNHFFNFFVSIFNHYEIYSKGIYTSSGGNVFYGIFILLFILATLLTNEGTLRDKKVSSLLYLASVASVFYIVGARSTLIIRIADYFGIFVPMFIPLSIRYISDKFSNSKLAKMILYIVVMIITFIIMYYKLSRNMGEIVPYQI